MNYPTVDDARAAELFHPNCGHRLYAYIEGLSNPEEATPEETLKNKVEYKARQKQRYLERKLRKWKRRQAVAITPQDKLKAKSYINKTYDKLKKHITDNGLTRQVSREGIGKTRYGNNPAAFKNKSGGNGTDKFIAERAVAAYERQTGQPAPPDFLTNFLPKMAGVKDYTTMRKTSY
ncbi:hypothetical protein AGMMS49975_22900 [Clostridia bacterium]|nr:hypothetical protein AGMMS49975_22900 [Clostridia bacterium]